MAALPATTRRVALTAAAVLSVVVTVAAVSAAHARAAASSAPTVGLVVTGRVDDHGVNRLAYEGIVRAERELGVRARVLTAGGQTGMNRKLRAFARHGYDLVVAVGQDAAGPVAAAAKAFPRTTFAIVDVDQRSLDGKPANVVGLVFDDRQVGYLAGYLAALTERRRKGTTLGAVGDADDVGATRFFSAFRSGARKAVPGIRVVRDVEKGADRNECEALARKQIEDGSGVVVGSPGACNRGALAAASGRRAWGIAVDADDSPLAPFVLASTVKGADVAVFAAIRSLASGTLVPGRTLRFGLEGGGVRLGRVNALAARADVDAVRRVERLLAGG